MKRGQKGVRSLYLTSMTQYADEAQKKKKKRGQIFVFDKFDTICRRSPMARPLRIQYPGVYCYVINRCNHQGMHGADSQGHLLGNVFKFIGPTTAKKYVSDDE